MLLCNTSALLYQLISLKLAFYRTDKTVIGCSGFHGDCLTLTKIIEARLKVGAFVHVCPVGTIHKILVSLSMTWIREIAS